jgi:uncharacterized protein DUF488
VTGEAGTLSTVGHGTLGRPELGALLQAHGIGQLVDVRRFPGSRRHPDLSRDALAGWLPGLGIGYRWDERLGGRRRLPAGEPVVDTWWTVPAFAAYAAHTRSDEFRSGMISWWTRPPPLRSPSCAARRCGGAATGVWSPTSRPSRGGCRCGT